MLDGDDYYFDPNFIQKAANEIQKLSQDVLFYKAGCLSVKTWKNEEIVFNLIEPKFTICNAIDYLKNIQSYGFAHLGIVYNRKKAMQTGFYLKNISSSDMDSIFRLILNNGKFMILV